MKYIKSFADTSTMNEYIEDIEQSGYYLFRDESKSGAEQINYMKIIYIPEFCVTARVDSSVKFNGESGADRQLLYTLDFGETWTPYTNGEWISLPAGQKIHWKTANTNTINARYGDFSFTGQVDLSGNILSLLLDNYQTLSDLNTWGKGTYSYPKHGLFQSLFGGQTAIINAKRLKFPLTQLNGDMICGTCISMFQNCSNLVTGPTLPTSLSNVVTNLVYSQTYGSMFSGCTSLREIKCYATKIDFRLTNWLSNVAATGTFYKKKGVTWPTGASGIPSGWTVIEVDV